MVRGVRVTNVIRVVRIGCVVRVVRVTNVIRVLKKRSLGEERELIGCMYILHSTFYIVELGSA